MGNRIAASIVVLVLALFASLANAQRGQRGGPGPAHDPRDLNGVWLLADDDTDDMPGIPWTRETPAMTPDGKARFDANKPAKGPRAIHPAFYNDPLGEANPPGLMRTLVYSRPIEFVQLQDKVLQVFEWAHFWRQVWMDGRPVPDDPGPLWYGYSVGKWEGDTWVVETVGLDPRQWLDDWGTPYSDAMRVQERWRRLDRDNMELTVRIDDPKTLTKPWVSDKKMFRFQPKESRNAELLEVIFAPMDEKEYNDRIRNPGGGVTSEERLRNPGGAGTVK
jgi:hypothetical protein